MASGRLMLFLGLFTLNFIHGVIARVDYTGYQVYRVYPGSMGTRNLMWKHLDGASYELDLWGEDPVAGTLDLLVPPLAKTKLRDWLAHLGTSYTIHVDNVQRLIDIERATMQATDRLHLSRRRRRRRRRQAAPGEDRNTQEAAELLTLPVWNEASLHHPNDSAEYLMSTILGRVPLLIELYTWMELTEITYPGLVTVETFGQSYLGQDLRYAKVSSPPVDGVDKRAVLVNGAMHGSEWITPPTVAYIMHQVIQLWDQSSQLASLVREYDWYFIPVLNVDGYLYTQEDRLWRKSRSRHPNSLCRRHRRRTNACVGVDMNRNFDFMWNITRDHRARFYKGPNPSSEPEVQHLSTLMHSLQGQLHVYLDLHAPLKSWYTPWAYTNRQPPDYDDLMSVGNASALAMQRAHGMPVPVGSPAVHVGLRFGGTAMDYAKGVVGVKYAYAPELRKSGEGVLINAPGDILICSEETWAAVEAMLGEIHRLRHLPPPPEPGVSVHDRLSNSELASLLSELTEGEEVGLSEGS